MKEDSKYRRELMLCDIDRESGVLVGGNPVSEIWVIENFVENALLPDDIQYLGGVFVKELKAYFKAIEGNVEVKE